MTLNVFYGVQNSSGRGDTRYQWSSGRQRSWRQWHWCLSIFLCNFTYRIWLPSLIKSIPGSMHPSSPTCNTSGASVLMRRGANNRNDNSWNHSIPLEISKYHETYKHFNDRTFYLITMTKLRSCSVGHHTGAWGHDNEDRPPPPLLPYPPLTMPK